MISVYFTNHLSLTLLNPKLYFCFIKNIVWVVSTSANQSRTLNINSNPEKVSLSECILNSSDD